MSAAHGLIQPASEVAVRLDETGELEVVTIIIDATRATLQMRGEMDLANCDLLSAVLDNQLGRGRRFLRLDLSPLGFCDCSGLRAIVHGHNRCLAARGTLVLTGMTPLVTRLLNITHLDEALFVADGQSGPRHTRRPHLSATAAQ